jgi:hypothetical protein
VNRLGRIAPACAICVSLVFGVSESLAAQLLPTPRVATALAKVIRRDARQQIRRHKTSVTVTKRCCGVRILRVRYTVRATGDTKQDSYVLSVLTKDGVLRGVSVSQSATEAGPSQALGSGETRWESRFAIDHAGPNPNRGWSFSYSYGESGQTVGPPNGPSIGLGFSQECRLPRPVPRLLYMEILVTLGRAKRHVVSRLGRLPSAACEPQRQHGGHPRTS